MWVLVIVGILSTNTLLYRSLYGVDTHTHKWLMRHAVTILENNGKTECANLMRRYMHILASEEGVMWPDLNSTSTVPWNPLFSSWNTAFYVQGRYLCRAASL